MALKRETNPRWTQRTQKKESWQSNFYIFTRHKMRRWALEESNERVTKNSEKYYHCYCGFHALTKDVENSFICVFNVESFENHDRTLSVCACVWRTQEHESATLLMGNVIRFQCYERSKCVCTWKCSISLHVYKIQSKCCCALSVHNNIEARLRCIKERVIKHYSIFQRIIFAKSLVLYQVCCTG